MSNDKQQTAVEFLEICFIRNASISVAEFKQSKEMEKQQKIMDYEMGYINGGNQKNISGEQYINETYGGYDAD
jgi:hypothetical protein